MLTPYPTPSRYRPLQSAARSARYPLARIPHALGSRAVRATWRLLPRPTGTFVVSCSDGIQMEIDPRARGAVDAALFYHGVYEAGTIRVMREVLSPGDVFVDVGAYTGYLALIASKYVASTGRVYAFEPNPPTVDVLRRNIFRNQVVNVTIEAIALSDAKSSVRLGQVSGNAGRASLGVEPVDGSVEVATARLDSFDLAPRFIKIDVEGHEAKVIVGAVRTMEKHRPVLSIEASESTSSRFVLGALTDMGYHLMVLSGGKDSLTKLVRMRRQPVHDNVFAFPR